MSLLYTSKMSRRATLQWLAAAAAASGISPYTWAGADQPAVQSISKGYGTDPDLNNPTVPWSRTMSAHQLQLTAMLADLILPETETAPAPSAIGIPDFVDEWVSAPYPQQRADRAIILGGLTAIDAEARQRWQRGFLELDDGPRLQIGEAIALKNTATASPENAFFHRFRYVVVGAYYTTSEGLKDIGYVGNVPLPSYPSVTEQERTILDAELKKLGNLQVHSQR